ncbi:TfoX/Sxy family protein [Pseudocolwellia sp. HL-MZ19]|uniref:TfoX/Sxy family protein n=1 Tax=unclassified Pseudocolwellia TaxID=2848178 RepID=UPI003CEA7B0F
MAFDRGLEERLYEHFQARHDLVVKKMFGGLCFILSEHMCCAIIDDKIMARVGPHNYFECLDKPYVTEMDFTGKPVKGLVYILPEGFESDDDLSYWINFCISFVDSLPPKAPKKAKQKKKPKITKEQSI